MKTCKPQTVFLAFNEKTTTLISEWWNREVLQ